ncbi:MAG: sulfotransferase [Alphaproteobacteria bacterium]|nr:MAG: sulfotransferase [Alphaproteobacteria bacterium]
MTLDKRFLFLCGVPRSGTTAFAELLNLHPQIAVGVERYKSLAMSGKTIDQFTPGLFDKERFFDFRETDTNVRADAAYEIMRNKYSEAKWVGDKVPRYYTKLRFIFERFPNPIVFYIVRDIYDVSQSWNARARNEKDRWPSENDYQKAPDEWNKGNALALKWLDEAPENFFVVSYKSLFSSGEDKVRLILEKLDLTMNDDFVRGYNNFLNRGHARKAKIIVPEEEIDLIRSKSDIDQYDELLRRAL